MTKVGILEAGRPAPEAVKLFGDWPRMFRTYFTDQQNLLFETFAIFENGIIPEPERCDAWLITGSSSSVYECLPWIAPLEALARSAVDKSIPILGICFGHQLMAQAFGGKVEKSAKGRGIGVHRHNLTNAGKEIFSGLEAIHLMASHQDQVVEQPPHTTLLAASDFCQCAGLAYGRSGLSIQGHPEISYEFERFIIESWQKSDPVDPQIAATALQSLDSIESDAQRILPVFNNFLNNQNPVPR